ncbi:MAG: exo-alpha-sialidase, partial [Planctomycetes bacterium]|nr:exo-alpha-sialidase [Planctomycetota bacterium]
LSSGRILAPVAWTEDCERADHYVSLCWISDDGGGTWRRGRGQVDLPRRGAMEPEVLELKDGRLLMILRTQLGHIAASRSSDGGETWSPAEPWGVRSPESPATLRRIPGTGDILLLWNDTYVPGAGHGGRRTPLAAAISKDEGRTWGPARTLEAAPDEGFAYASLAFAGDRALMSYYVEDSSTRRISARFRSVPLARLYGQEREPEPGEKLEPAAKPEPAAPRLDPRDLRAGREIPGEGYCDQPYIVVTADGGWLCVLTTGKGKEGQRGQHVVATRSSDEGRTWSPPVDIEPAAGPEASWAVPFAVSSGRVHVVYVYNGDRIDALGGKKGIRADMLGWYVYRWSDDGGRTWSPERRRIPVRVTACDRGNDWGGAVQIFWGIAKPVADGGAVLLPFTKLGRYMLEDGEGWLLRSENLLAEVDPARIEWRLLPEGEAGIRAPELGSVQEEHNVARLGDGTLLCVYRTTRGFPCESWSRDGGRTWTRPEPMRYAPGGRPFKHPRACPRLWRTAEGRFLFWFHNHGGRTFEGRNPAWVSGGVERDGRVHWSQPEILLYDAEPATRMSYPDLVEAGGRSWISETQKTIARVHELDAGLLEGLWSQGSAPAIHRTGLAAESRRGGSRELALPGAFDLRATGGLTLELWLEPGRLAPGEALAECRDEAGRGIALLAAADGAVELVLGDGRARAAWASDPGALEPGAPRHVVAIAEAGPRIIAFVVDGVLADGGDRRERGWGRWTGELGDVRGAGRLRLAPAVVSARLYARPLRVSEAVAHRWAGP